MGARAPCGPRSSNRQVVQALTQVVGIVDMEEVRSRRFRICASDNVLYDRAWWELFLSHQLLSSLKSSKPFQRLLPCRSSGPSRAVRPGSVLCLAGIIIMYAGGARLAGGWAPW
jgi:hypothetical protein